MYRVDKFLSGYEVDHVELGVASQWTPGAFYLGGGWTSGDSITDLNSSYRLKWEVMTPELRDLSVKIVDDDKTVFGFIVLREIEGLVWVYAHDLTQGKIEPMQRVLNWLASVAPVRDDVMRKEKAKSLHKMIE